jgi:diguanylate cyclase (GGDEF)-like protein
MEIPEIRVLVIGDRQQQIDLTNQLGEAGYKAVPVENGERATEMLRSTSFDLALIDAVVLGTDDGEFLRAAQADEVLQRIPFLVVAENENWGSVMSCIEMGAADYLVKPFSSEMLRLRLDSCLKHRQHQREIQSLRQKVEEQGRQLDELSIRDSLTTLFNGSYFDEQGNATLAQAQRYNQPLTVMIGDIDFFKSINEKFSHAVGDEVLRHIAQILEDSTRQSDMVARYGGEEFVIAFSQTPLFQALPLCEKLRARIEHHEWSDIHPELKVTMSMGLCDDIQLQSFEKLVIAADEKLNEAKSGGRNRVCANGYTEAQS